MTVMRPYLYRAFLLLLIVTLSLPLPASAPAAGFNPQLQAMLQSALARGVTDYAIPGAVMAVRDPQGNVAYFTTGLANTATGQAVTTNLHFHIGSITKTFVATATLILVDQNVLRLDDTIEKYLPGKVSRGDEITLRNLLQMRSGLGQYGTTDDFSDKLLAPLRGLPIHEFTMDELIGYSNINVYEPGARYEYNNINYLLLGWIMEAATGETWEDLVYRLIINPLGLNNTSAPTTPEMTHPYAHGYLNPATLYDDLATAEWYSLDVSTSLTMSAFGAAGCMISTVDDMLAWLPVLLSGELLSASSHAEQTNLIQSETDHYWYYGMGILNNFGLVGHAGNLNSYYTATMYRYEGYDIVMLCNGQLADADDHASAHYVTLRLKCLFDAVE